MINKVNRIVLISVTVFLLWAVIGCASKENAILRSNDIIAKNFTEMWLNRWNSMEEKGMLMPRGNAFLADLNKDTIPELFFIYPEWRDSTVVVFEIGNDQIIELGSFKASAFSSNNNLVFDVYAKDDGNILHTESHLTVGVINPTNPVTDYYITFDGEKLEEKTLYKVEVKDAETKYFESPTDDTEITKTEYDKRFADIIGSANLLETIKISSEEEAIDFLSEDTFTSYILSLLNQWDLKKADG